MSVMLRTVDGSDWLLADDWSLEQVADLLAKLEPGGTLMFRCLRDSSPASGWVRAQYVVAVYERPGKGA